MTTSLSDRYDYKCGDCGLPFEEGEARNASLDPTEFNVACPSCGGDNIEPIDKGEK